MHDLCTYHVDVMGEVDEAAMNASGPIIIQAKQTKPEITRLSARADQSGLIGLLRHLHQQGYVLLSVSRKLQTIVQEAENENGRCA